jgi:hypothetical protein
MRKHTTLLLSLLLSSPSHARITIPFLDSLPRNLFKGGGFGAFGGKAGGNYGCQVLAGTNYQRNKNRRPQIFPNKRLDASAMIACQNMAYYDTFDHTAGGSTPGQRAQSTGYDWNAVAENIYFDSGYGPADPQRAIKGWVESPGHFKNMMGDFRHMGSAHCTGRGGKIFWAQEFGTGDEDPNDVYDCGGDQPALLRAARAAPLAVAKYVPPPVVVKSYVAPLPIQRLPPCIATNYGNKNYKRSLNTPSKKRQKSKARSNPSSESA